MTHFSAALDRSGNNAISFRSCLFAPALCINSITDKFSQSTYIKVPTPPGWQQSEINCNTAISSDCYTGGRPVREHILVPTTLLPLVFSFRRLAKDLAAGVGTIMSASLGTVLNVVAALP
mmetsp:Transcript_32937/g.71279  ORF Transcript_32937/g.71279 Transcript_32937/m.71279 type:complete len:120 (+) Transcript_32937:237-596(+)